MGSEQLFTNALIFEWHYGKHLKYATREINTNFDGLGKRKGRDFEDLVRMFYEREVTNEKQKIRQLEIVETLNKFIEL